jgi:hypothetical protein
MTLQRVDEILQDPERRLAVIQTELELYVLFN